MGDNLHVLFTQCLGPLWNIPLILLLHDVRVCPIHSRRRKCGSMAAAIKQITATSSEIAFIYKICTAVNDESHSSLRHTISFRLDESSLDPN